MPDNETPEEIVAEPEPTPAPEPEDKFKWLRLARGEQQ